jgi:hypothetical protein
MSDVTPTIDLTGGLDRSIDEITAEVPSDPAYREGHNMWIWDDEGRLGFPRIAVEVVGATWETARNVVVPVAMPDGRLLLSRCDAPAIPVRDAAGRPRVIGAGPLRFECIEPFVRWHLEFDGQAIATTLQERVAGGGPASGSGGSGAPAGDIPVFIDLETQSVAPPWVQGSLGGEGFVPGEDRFEQLFRAQGTVRIGGEEMSFSGGGLRIHRKGGNRTPTGDFFGHVWCSAFFPSGRAFGFIHYYPRPDGSLKFCEGWALEDGEVVAAEILDRPWLQTAHVDDDKFCFTLRTRSGDTRVEARTYASNFSPGRAAEQGKSFPALQQGIAQYRWEGEEAYGMVERGRHLNWS